MIHPLYPHNQKAYEAVKAHYAEGHRKACVVHATGTGKSYIIGALAEDYERVLVVAPNDYVLDQVRRNAGDEITYVTYAKLMADARTGRTPSGQYDLIVLDEYHRAGAELWCEGVQAIIAANPDALLFGTTATDIRYLDDRRNMSQELFGGHVVSTITIGEAWARSILQAPVYVCTLEDFSETYHTYEQRIQSSKANREEKEKLAHTLSTARKDWESVGGVPAIIRKHLSDDVKRIIVFCPDIHSTTRYRKMIRKWFSKAGIRIARVYTIESTKSPRTNLKEMSRFQEDKGEGVKIMISVNMLNEGIHVPRVDAVIMLRGTASGNIYLQQMGRCMHTGSTGRRPVVLDLANNISSAFSLASTAFERRDYERAVSELSREPGSKKPGGYMEVVDYLMGTREVLSKLDERMAYLDRWAVWDKRYSIAKKYFEENGKFPGGKQWEWLRMYFSNDSRKRPDKERKAMLMAIGWRPEEDMWTVNYKTAKAFYEKNGRFPTLKDNRKVYEYMQKWVSNRGDMHPDKMEMLQAIGWKSKPFGDALWEERYREAKAIYKETGKFPTNSSHSKIWQWFYAWVKRCGDNEPKKMKMLQRIGFSLKRKDWEERYMEAKAIFEETGKFPPTRHSSGLYNWAWSWARKNAGSEPERMQMLLDIGFTATKNKKK